jgi:hypothetical protein
MGQTAAQVLIQEGREVGVIEGREIGTIETMQKMLVKQMNLKFGLIPQSILQRIQTLRDTNQLDQLSGCVITANTLQEMGIE